MAFDAALITQAIRPVRFGDMAADVTREADGSLRLVCRQALRPYPARTTDPLDHWARVTPNHPFLAQRDASGGWRTISYRDMLARVEAVAEQLLQDGLDAGRPIVTLSANTIEHAVMLLAAQHAGIPVAPLTPAYGLHGPDYKRLCHAVTLLAPGMLYVEDGVRFAASAAAAGFDGKNVVVGANASAIPGSRLLSDLLEPVRTRRLEAARAMVGPDSIAKFLLTSGSTGTPKAVINTHRMICSNQAQLAHCFAFVTDAPPVMVDWLPWNHTAGGNHNFNLVLFNGGTLFIDEGKPLPGLIETTLRNLRDVSPTLYFNVPIGYEMLAQRCREDAELRDSFFSDLKLMWYAGAAMPKATWAAMDALGVATVGARVAMVSSLGMTETAPGATMSMPGTTGAGRIGTPLPGVETKLVPVDDVFEVRFRGPNVTPGYLHDAVATEKAFDEEGYYRTGDAIRLLDAGDPGQGLMFSGRISEDFKLSSGTWVRVGRLREDVLLALEGYAADVVVAGPDRGAIAVLIFVDPARCRALGPELAGAALPDLVRSPLVEEAFRIRLAGLFADATGSSNRVTAAVLLTSPPSSADGELTEKGTVNQRGVLRSRANAVEALYRLPRPAEIIGLDRPARHAEQGAEQCLTSTQ